MGITESLRRVKLGRFAEHYMDFKKACIIGDSIKIKPCWTWGGPKQPCWLSKLKEKNLWEIRERSNGRKLGFVGVYVDDIIVASPEEIAEDFLLRLNEAWECSAPQWVEETMKQKQSFVGMKLESCKMAVFTISTFLHPRPFGKTRYAWLWKSRCTKDHRWGERLRSSH